MKQAIPRLSHLGEWLQSQASIPLAGNLVIPKISLNNVSESSGDPILLHGDLDLWINEARCLPNMDSASKKLMKDFTNFAPYGTCLKEKFKSLEGSVMTTDPYVSVCIAGAIMAQTRVVSNSENPSWKEHFIIPIAHPVVKVEFLVKDNDDVGAELIGVVELPAEKLITGDALTGWFPIVGCSGTLNSIPELHLSLKFKTVEGNPAYKDGIGASSAGVHNTYFPLRRGGYVTLYQDAHTPDAMLPDISLDDGKVFQQKKCWEEICQAILEARHLIYIVGWSVYHLVKLVREPRRPLPSGGELFLGDLLKFKSQEGVRVIMLIWDDKTSNDDFFVKTDGIMQTHDEETKKFFRHSSIHCVLCPRFASSKLSIVEQQVVGNLFTHHQKCVIVDTESSGNTRKISAFIGGLDLCDGRYDTPEHRLFSDLDSVFANDIHNPTFTNCKNGPRQPWHDLHCKIEGPAAYDILTNFEQRYRKAIKWRDFKLMKVKQILDDALLKLDQISWILTPSPGPDGDQNVRVTDERDPETWHVQVFRSIDSGSVKGFPKDPKEAELQNLACGKNVKVDRSIHTAYVKAIRSSQHFIYIENQYFLGSSYNWQSYRNAGADNLVPMELALKISSKICAKEHFPVYIVIPMWPEGLPTSSAVQEILFWQAQTMAMMYKIVAQALEEVGLSGVYHPLDYLNFYCLGKREEAPSEYTSQAHPPCENPALKLAQEFRRFMIYVHSKGMVVDDEYVLIGSANINQRSLDGSRDTEIAMGAYQPNYTWTVKKNHPRGQVYGYRMSLWAEHLGTLEDSFQKPGTVECVRRVNEIAKENWNAYVSNEYKEMRGHLMQYPIQVSRSGEVTALPGFECFPDVGGKVLGAPTNLPDALTT